LLRDFRAEGEGEGDNAVASVVVVVGDGDMLGGGMIVGVGCSLNVSSLCSLLTAYLAEIKSIQRKAKPRTITNATLCLVGLPGKISVIIIKAPTTQAPNIKKCPEFIVITPNKARPCISKPKKRANKPPARTLRKRLLGCTLLF
jgi:hypothetical protein